MVGTLRFAHPTQHRAPVSAPLTKRQQNQPFMVNPLLSVMVYFF
jgi:hypothetical protein